VASLISTSPGAERKQFTLESAGARFGFPGNYSAAGFHQAEVFADFDLPWNWDLGKEWWLETRVDFSAGWLGGSAGNAFIGSAGPAVVFGHGKFPVTFEVGVGPAVLSHHEFASKNLGTWAQFTTHAGLNLDMGPRWRLNYRFQHLSNAGLSTDNPGLNLHLVGFSYVF